MSPTDAMFLLAESPTHPMHVGAVQVFAPPPGRDARDVAAAFENALATHEMSSALRRKASRSVSSLGQWSWQPDARYRVDNHVHRHTLSQPAGTAELWALCSRLHSGMLDRSRPLWEMHLIDGLADGRYAVYTKMHHAMADGVAAIRRRRNHLRRPDGPARRTAGRCTSDRQPIARNLRRMVPLRPRPILVEPHRHSRGVEGGLVHLADEPGLGWELDWDYVDRHRVE